jgi:hypothetical protein
LGQHVHYLWQAPLICLHQACFADQEWKGCLYDLFEHFLGPTKVGNMASAADTRLNGTLYNGGNKRLTWETYARIHTEQHSVLNGLKDYGYAGIDDSSKVCHLLKGIKTTELDVCKTQVMASPSLRDDFAATVELYSTFIKKMKA